MKIYRNNYQLNKLYVIDTEVSFKDTTFPEYYRIKEIKSCNAHIELTNFESCLEMNVTLSGVVLAICGISLQEFDYPYQAQEILSFSDNPDDEVNFYEPRPFALEPYLLSLIDDAVPINVKKPGAKPISNGDGYRIISEEELEKERKEKKDPRFAILDEIDFDK